MIASITESWIIRRGEYFLPWVNQGMAIACAGAWWPDLQAGVS